MKKLIELCKCSNPWRIYRNGSKFNQFLGCQSRTLTNSAPSEVTTTAPKTNLYMTLALARESWISVVPILDQWFEEGGQIDQEKIHNVVKQLRYNKRFNHCLQIIQWMSDKKVTDPSPKDVSVQLDLISKVHGVVEAENYFNNLPNTLKVCEVYGTLLNCYVIENLVDKAEATMQKIKNLGYARSAFAYNRMLTLYAQMGAHDKLNLLVQEMGETGAFCDIYTYNVRLKAYGDSMDIKQMEMLLAKMEADPFITMDQFSYYFAAKAYIKAGDTNKALETLKKFEHLIQGDKRIAYERLITLYASVGKKDEVYRIWDLYKNLGFFLNMAHYHMICSLCKLNDFDGAEKILEEWEAGQKYYDIRLLNSLITGYCKKGMVEKAELIVEKRIERGWKPSPSTWNRISFGYIKLNHMDKAVEALKKEIAVSNPKSKPDNTTLASCLDYLYGKGDADGAEEIVKSLQEKGMFTRNLYYKLMETMKNGDQIAGKSFDGSRGSCLL